ncbi:MAG: DUF512 domain-containing protein [Christensenellales bacterium]
MHQVLSVDQGSLAARHGLAPGDLIVSINGEPLIDEVDYQALTAVRHVNMRVIKADGREKEVDIVKPEYAPLGVHFEDTLVCDPRSCTNHCVFCFVDQMPEGMRKTLYVKDDDWRLSLMMGNFVTLTNVNDREFDRIVRRRAHPLYVSVHATNPQVRVAMLRQPRAALLMSRLERLKSEGMTFHCQIVLVPGMNDGEVLKETLGALLDFYPAMLSIALVPVGLTKYRAGLTEIHPYTQEQAREILDICEAFQRTALCLTGKRLVYPADELLCIAKATLPSSESYEGYPQLENGIGMIRQFEEELLEAQALLPAIAASDKSPHTLLACGTSIAPYMRDWVLRFAPEGTNVKVRAVTNQFFGESVTVSGLIVGADLAEQLSGSGADLVLIPDSMLNSDKTMFLDNMSIAEVEKRLAMRVYPIACSGEAFLDALRHLNTICARSEYTEGDKYAGI